MSGRSSISYRALSRCLVSLASAGTVCCAKPNHGFYGCQQAIETFFRPPPRGRRPPAFPLHHARVSHYPVHAHAGNQNSAAALCFQCLQRIGQLITTSPGGDFFAKAFAGDLPAWLPEARRIGLDTDAGFRGAQALLRENCAVVGGEGSPPAGVTDGAANACSHAPTPPAPDCIAQKKTGRTWRPVGIETRCELSGRLPRAVRRSRRDRAIP